MAKNDLKEPGGNLHEQSRNQLIEQLTSNNQKFAFIFVRQISLGVLGKVIRAEASISDEIQ